MAFACKYCIMYKGLKGSDVANLPQTEEELYNHIEHEHHIPVRRENENGEQCMARFKLENPEAGGPNCKCPNCIHERSLKVPA